MYVHATETQITKKKNISELNCNNFFYFAYPPSLFLLCIPYSWLHCESVSIGYQANSLHITTMFNVPDRSVRAVEVVGLKGVTP